MIRVEFMPTKKERVMFLCEKETRDELQSWADEEGRSLSNLIERQVLSILKTRSDGVTNADESGDQSETLEMLLGFLNYLIDHFDHDGYSLSEISKLLGRPDDKGLVALVQKLQQNGQAQPKSGAKVK